MAEPGPPVGSGRKSRKLDCQSRSFSRVSERDCLQIRRKSCTKSRDTSRRGRLQPALELGDRDQNASATPDDPQLGANVLIEVVRRNTERGRCFIEREG